MLKLKDLQVDVILQQLVGEVDAELLEAVCLPVLESKHIQDTDGQELKTTTTGQLISNIRMGANVMM